MTIEPEPTSRPVPSRRSSTRRLLSELPRPEFRAGAVVVLVIAALVVAILVSLFTSGGAVRTIGGVELSADASAVPAATPGSTAPAGSAAGELFIHVLGAVAAPGVYRLPDGSRAFDAVASAGGLLPEADTSAVNLARFVNDGEQLYVPVVGEVPPGGGAGSAAGSPSGSQLVNVNTASAAELTALPRIGEALAARIVAWREANGPFATLDDLSAVEGIGAKTLEGLRAAATV